MRHDHFYSVTEHIVMKTIGVFHREPYSVRSGNFVYIRVIKLKTKCNPQWVLNQDL